MTRHNMARKLYYLVNKEKILYQGMRIDEIYSAIKWCEKNCDPSEKTTIRVRIRLQERKNVLEKPALTHNGYSFFISNNDIIEKITYSRMSEILNNLIPGSEKEAKLKEELLNGLDFSMIAFPIKNNYSEDLMFINGFGEFCLLSISDGYDLMGEAIIVLMQEHFLGQCIKLIETLSKKTIQSEDDDDYSSFVYDVFYRGVKLETLIAFLNDASMQKLSGFFEKFEKEGKKSSINEINENIKRLVRKRKEQLIV